MDSILIEIIVHFFTQYTSNLISIALSTNIILYAHTKHIELDLYFVHEKVLNSVVHVQHLLSFEQVIDILTKPLRGSLFRLFQHKLSVIQLSLNLRGNVKVPNNNYILQVNDGAIACVVSGTKG